MSQPSFFPLHESFWQERHAFLEKQVAADDPKTLKVIEVVQKTGQLQVVKSGQGDWGKRMVSIQQALDKTPSGSWPALTPLQAHTLLGNLALINARYIQVLLQSVLKDPIVIAALRTLLNISKKDQDDDYVRKIAEEFLSKQLDVGGVSWKAVCKAMGVTLIDLKALPPSLRDVKTVIHPSVYAIEPSKDLVLSYDPLFEEICLMPAKKATDPSETIENLQNLQEQVLSPRDVSMLLKHLQSFPRNSETVKCFVSLLQQAIKFMKKSEPKSEQEVVEFIKYLESIEKQLRAALSAFLLVDFLNVDDLLSDLLQYSKAVRVFIKEAVEKRMLNLLQKYESQMYQLRIQKVDSTNQRYLTSLGTWAERYAVIAPKIDPEFQQLVSRLEKEFNHPLNPLREAVYRTDGAIAFFKKPVELALAEQEAQQKAEKFLQKSVVSIGRSLGNKDALIKDLLSPFLNLKEDLEKILKKAVPPLPIGSIQKMCQAITKITELFTSCKELEDLIGRLTKDRESIIANLKIIFDEVAKDPKKIDKDEYYKTLDTLTIDRNTGDAYLRATQLLCSRVWMPLQELLEVMGTSHSQFQEIYKLYFECLVLATLTNRRF
jgi:hypothetical protein